MFEYWFLGLSDGDGSFDHTGTTHDFLEVVSQIAQLVNPEVAGKFVSALLTEHKEKLAFLRVVDWNFEFSHLRSENPDDWPCEEIIIKLHKSI